MITNNFSVLMSVYAKENPKYLSDALDSIFQQNLLANEVVIVKDGPLTDELDSVIETYEKRYSELKVVAIPENKGLGLALNEGLKHCSYDWVARMDTDDVALKNRFQVQVDFINSHPEIDLVGSDIQEFSNEIDEIVSYKKMPTEHFQISEMLKQRTPVCHMTVFFRKQAVIDAGNYLDLPYVEDYYLWSRMIVNGSRFANIPKGLVLVRVGNGMAKRRGNRKSISSWKTVQQFLLKNNVINRIEYIKNMIIIRIFIYTPASVKELLYKYILRRSGVTN
ncbi:TPA: glycosyltransferase [Streptococcus suis]|nr:glycosyltransferase [Streptococcus suis]